MPGMYPTVSRLSRFVSHNNRASTILLRSAITAATAIAVYGYVRFRYSPVTRQSSNPDSGASHSFPEELHTLKVHSDTTVDPRQHDRIHEVGRLKHQANALLICYKRSGGSAVLLVATANYRCAMRICEEDQISAELYAILVGLGRSLVCEYHRTGALPALREGIRYLELALAAAPIQHADHTQRTIDLADALTHLYDYTGSPICMERAIRMLTTVTSAPLSQDPLYPTALAHLAFAELCESALDFTNARYAERIEHLMTSLRGCTQSGRCTNLAIVLLALARVEVFQCVRDYNSLVILDAERHAQSALHHDSLDWINQVHIHRALASVYYTKILHQRPSSTEDYAAGLRHASLGLNLTVHNPIARTLVLQAFSTLYSEAPDEYRSLALLTQKMDIAEEAYRLIPRDHRVAVVIKTNIIDAYGRYYEHTGSIRVLDRIIALDRSDSNDTYPLLLYNIGSAMHDRVNAFKERRLVHLLDRGYELLQRCYESLDPSSPYRVRPLVIMSRIRQLQCDLGVQNPLEKDSDIVVLNRQLVKDCGPTSPSHDKLTALKDLSHLLISRSMVTSCLSDIDEADRAVTIGLELAQGDPEGRHQLSVCQARASFARCHLTATHSEANSAWQLYRTLASDTEVRPRDRFLSALQWIRDAGVARDSFQEIAAYRSAIGILPLLGHIEHSAVTRREALVYARGLACSAASRALYANDTRTAIQFLEEGRGIFWGQLLQLRWSRAEEVASTDEADRIEQLVHLLQAAEDESWAQRRSQAEELEILIKRVRSRSGQPHGLYSGMPKPFPDVMAAAKRSGGFIVIVVPGESSCDVMLLGGPHEAHLQVEALDIERLERMCERLRSGAADERSSCSDDARGMKKVPPSSSLVSARRENERVLSELWKTLVEPVVRFLELKVSFVRSPISRPTRTHRLQRAVGRSRPRLWWVLTGPLTFLPIHAAGRRQGSMEGEYLSDYAVSSYIPTLSALVQAQTCTPASVDSKSGASRTLLLAPLENLSNLPHLPHASEEVGLIEQALGPQGVLLKDGSTADQTVDSVLRLIPQANIVHFACHGRQIDADPLQSGFELSDGRLTLSHLMRLHIPYGQLAYLSACESAAVDANQPDEAVNIATAMLYVGFKSVIATLW
jgi:hypothetical protein